MAERGRTSLAGALVASLLAALGLESWQVRRGEASPSGEGWAGQARESSSPRRLRWPGPRLAEASGPRASPLAR
jgi:hypothetical protein